MHGGQGVSLPRWAAVVQKQSCEILAAKMIPLDYDAPPLAFVASSYLS